MDGCRGPGIDVNILTHEIFFGTLGNLMKAGYDGSGVSTVASMPAGYIAQDVAVDAANNVAFVAAVNLTSTDGMVLVRGVAVCAVHR